MGAVLIVDDDVVIRDVLCELFSPEHTCHTAMSAEAALTLLQAGRYDVAIVDISLPGMSGLELLAHIRNYWPETPVIIITGIDYHKYTDELIRMGAFDYVAKPFELQNAAGKVARGILYHERWMEAVKESTDRALKSGKHPSGESPAWALERRGAVRRMAQRVARLLFTATQPGMRATAGGGAPAPTLLGYTRDISATGLSLIVPGVRRSDSDYYGAYSPLRITLSLPTANVEVRAIPVRYEWLDERDQSKGYLIGARITEMEGEVRGRFNEYLGTLP